MSQQRDLMNEFLARSRETLAPIRAELAEWFRKDIKKRKGPKGSTGFRFLLVGNAETPQPQFEFSWAPHESNRLLTFTPSQPVPEFATREDAVALNCLQYDGVAMLRSVAFQELTADAWIEADGFTFPKPLVIIKWIFDKPDSPRSWIDLFFELLEIYGNRGKVRQPYFVPSEPIPLPRVPADLIPSIREGDPDCLQEWADAMEVAGITSYAELLRWLPTFADSIREEVLAVAPTEGFSIVPSPDGSASWWIGDMFGEVENLHTRNLGRLLSAWNDLHPTVEWLLRQLQFSRVVLETITHGTYQVLPRRTVNLGGNGHLAPLDQNVAVVRLAVEGSDGG